jgi:hypothetical protein
MKKIARTLFSLSMLMIFMVGIVYSPNTTNYTNVSNIKKESTDNIEEQLSISPESAAVEYFDSLEIAERTAQWLISQANDSNGHLKWKSNNRTYYDYENGVAGIGIFFLNLYAQTLNNTYRDWANKIGAWLISMNSTLQKPGQWPSYVEELNPQYYTGLKSGSAGIGKFLCKLYDITQNNSYKLLANDVSSYLLSVSNSTSDVLSINLNEADAQTGPFSLPLSGNSNSIVVNPIDGSVPANTNDYFSTWANQQILTPNATNSESILHNVTTVTDIRISNASMVGINASFITQSFTFPKYPIFINQTNGLKLKMYTNSTNGTGTLVLSVYQADSEGKPTGNKIGSSSDNITATNLTTNLDGVWTSFNWTSNAPILNGSSLYGYVFVLEFLPGANWTYGQTFFIKASIGNSYLFGTLYLGNNQRNQDLLFEIRSDPMADLLGINYGVNITQFGIPSFNPNDITNITVRFTLNSSNSAAITGLQIWNYPLARWELLDFFTNSEITITRQFFQPEVKSYFSNDNFGVIILRVMGGRNDGSSFTVAVRQMNISVGYYYANVSYSIDFGLAGIGEFFLDRFNSFAESKDLTYATKIGNYLLSKAISLGTELYWMHKTGIDVSYLSGDSGIIHFLLLLAKYHEGNDIYLSAANKTGRRLSFGGVDIASYSRFDEYRPVENWMGTFNLLKTGKLTGIAGIGDVFLELSNRLSPFDLSSDYNFYSAARKIGYLLEATRINMSGLEFNGPMVNYYNKIAIRTDIINGSTISMNYAEGMIGTLSFLSNLQRSGFTTDYAGIIGNGLNYVKSVMNSSATWDLTLSINGTFNSIYGLFYGMAGIGNELRNIYIRPFDAQFGSQKISDLYISNIPNQIYSGVSYGIAGLGLSYIENYQVTKNNSYYFAAEACAQKLSNPAVDWLEKPSFYTANFTGIEKGFAGIGMFLLKMYQISNKDQYLILADYAATVLVQQQINGRWRSDNFLTSISYNGYMNGSAGIIHFLLEMYKSTNNSLYLNSAELGLNALIEEQLLGSGLWRNYNDTSAPKYYGYYYGAAGIADTFIYAYEVTRNITYLNVAQSTIFLLVNQPYFFVSATNNTYVLGLDYGYAGLIKVLRHIMFYNNSYKNDLERAIDTTYALINAQLASTNPNLAYESGLTGAVEELQNVIGFIISVKKDFNTAINHMINIKNLIVGANFTTSSPGYYQGHGGISVVLNKIIDFDFFNVIDYSPKVISQPAYNQTMDLLVTLQDSSLLTPKVQVRYFINKTFTTTYTGIFSQNSSNPSVFNFSIPAYPYNFIIDYYIIIEDRSTLNRFLMAGENTLFTYIVNDYFAPLISNISVNYRNIYPSLVYGVNGDGGGVIGVDVKEPAFASGVKSVKIAYIDITNPNLLMTNIEMTPYPNSNRYYHSIDTRLFNLTAPNNISCNITAIDYAGKVTIENYIFKVGDYEAPRLLQHLQTAIKPLYYTDEAMEISVMLDDNQTIGGSGFKRVYLRYNTILDSTPDKWNQINLTFDSFQKVNNFTGYIYKGAIPPQEPTDVIWYYVCAEDRAGNEVAYDKFGNIVAIDEVPVDVWFYSVERNWTKIIIYVAIAVGATVLGYLIYTRRGTYLDRMRREAGSTATAVAIKELLSSYYYAFMEWLTKLGDKSYDLMRAASLRERIGDWVQDNINSPFVKVFITIGGIIKTYIRNLLFVFIVPFVLLWKIITGAKGRQILFTAFIGIGLIVATVIKYFNHKGFLPLRAMFFIDFGFALFIASFGLIIIHLIYEIAYK